MIINLISGPRNISTALMTSFAQRPNIKVLDEPYYAYYLNISNVKHPGRNETIEALDIDLGKIQLKLERTHAEVDEVFIKNMAHHLIDLDLKPLSNFENVFLIRDPKQLIASFSKVIESPRMEDIGLKRALEIFRFLESETGHRPIVLNSNEVLRNPQKVLEELCNKLDIRFYPEMLSWPKGKIYDKVPWAKYWYKNVLESTGFTAPKNKVVELPENCVSLYEEALPYFEELNTYAIKA